MSAGCVYVSINQSDGMTPKLNHNTEMFINGVTITNDTAYT